MATSLVAELAEKLSSATNNLDFDEQTLFLNTSADTVGIGTNSPDGKLDVRQSGTDDILNLYDGTANVISVKDGGSFLIGNPATVESNNGISAVFQVEGTTAATSTMSIFRNSNDANSPQILLGKSRGTSVSSDTVIQQNDTVGQFIFFAADGTDRVSQVASISASIDASPAANDTPGRLIFGTTADGANSVSERMRIDDAGQVGIGTTGPASLLDVQGTVQVGVDDTGYDVKFFGATSGAYLEWDESADELEIRGGAATPGKLLLSTAETTVVDGNKLGQIDFQAPVDSAGTDAILVGASIHAEADATFSSSVNSTDLVLSTGNSATATERMRITSGGNVGIGVAPSSTVGDGDTLKGLSISQNTANGEYSYLQLLNRVENATTSNYIHVDFDHKTDGTTTIPLARISARPLSSTTGELSFSTSTSSSLSTAMTITSAGNVGIGTSSPDANGFGAGHGILTVASSTGSAKTAMLNIIGDGNDTADTRVASVFFNDASATGAGATLAGIEAYRATTHATDPGAEIRFSTNVSGGNYTNRMVINENGYVGIGTTVPVGVLQVNSAGAGDTAHIRLHNTNNTNNDTTSILFGFSGNDNANKGGIFFKRLASYGRGDIIFATKNTADNQNVDNSDVKMKIDSVGKVSIGFASGSAATTMLDIESGSNAGVRSKSTSETEKNYIGLSAEGGETFWVKENGDIYYSGTQSSDAKMKENIIDCPYGLDEVKKLSPKQFNFIGCEETKRQGFIAQETESVVPNMTSGDSSETAEANMGFDMQGVSAVLVKAVQELDSRLRELESA